MKDRVTLTNPAEILYIAQLIERDIQQIETHLKSRQEMLEKFKDRGVKNTKWIEWNASAGVAKTFPIISEGQTTVIEGGMS